MNYIDKPCEVCDNNIIEDLNFIDPVFHLPHISTPYEMEIITETNVGFWWENQVLNYIPYDFFVLKTRLRSYVPEEYDIDFYSYQYKDIMVFTVVFTNPDGKVQITQAQADYYQDLVDYFVQYEHCEMILDTNHLAWQNTILPYIKIDEQYEPIVVNNKLLINLHPDRFYHDETIKGYEVGQYYYDYLDVYLQLQKQILDQINNMYEKGTVVADPVIDRDVIEKYQLIKMDMDKEGLQLYTTTNTYDYDITATLIQALLK